MTDWVLSAQGVATDVETITRMAEEIGAVLRKAEYGTGSSQMYHPNGLLLHIHKLQQPSSGADAGESPVIPAPGDSPQVATPAETAPPVPVPGGPGTAAE